MTENGANIARPVLVVGSLNMDLVARCELLPRTGQTIFGQDFFTAAGGKGANQAVAAARLGASVAMAGCVGNDQFGRDLCGGPASVPASAPAPSQQPIVRPAPR